MSRPAVRSRECWYGKFSDDQCQNTARWAYGGKAQSNSLLQRSQWCDEHKHDDDVLMEPRDAD